jgi:hypothetical protein
MEGVGATGGRGGRQEPVAMMMSCARSWVQPASSPDPFVPPPTPSLGIHLKGGKQCFFNISPMASSIPLHDANSNVNANTLIKNVWEEKNVNLLF